MRGDDEPRGRRDGQSPPLGAAFLAKLAIETMPH